MACCVRVRVLPLPTHLLGGSAVDSTRNGLVVLHMHLPIMVVMMVMIGGGYHYHRYHLVPRNGACPCILLIGSIIILEATEMMPVWEHRIIKLLILTIYTNTND